MPLDFIHADGLNAIEVLMGHAPPNRMLDRLEHVSPGGVDVGGGQELSHCGGEN
jgi:hypothetical protein